MESTEKKILFWERMRALLLALILVVLMITAAGILRFTRQMSGYSDTLANVVTRLDDFTAELEKLETERMVSTVNGVIASLQKADVEGMVEAMAEITGQLRQVDWAALTGNMNDIAAQAKDSLIRAETAMDKVSGALEELDIEAMNTAIADLKTVVEPLASFVAKFG